MRADIASAATIAVSSLRVELPPAAISKSAKVRPTVAARVCGWFIPSSAASLRVATSSTPIAHSRRSSESSAQANLNSIMARLATIANAPGCSLPSSAILDLEALRRSKLAARRSAKLPWTWAISTRTVASSTSTAGPLVFAGVRMASSAQEADWTTRPASRLAAERLTKIRVQSGVSCSALLSASSKCSTALV